MSYPVFTEKPVVGGPMGGAERTEPGMVDEMGGGTADGEANGAIGLPYGGDDTEPKIGGGADDSMGGRVEVKATGGRGLEKLPGEKLETPAGVGRGRGLVIPAGSDGGLMVDVGGGGGVEGGVLSIPLSSIIFTLSCR